MLPGDIVLTAGNTFNAKGIRITTGGDFSHAILYVGNGSYIHSDLNGVHSDNPQRLILDALEMAKVFRLIKRDDQVIRKICDFSRSEIGKKYSKIEAVKSKALRNSQLGDNSNRQFCSRLVSQAYSFSGISLVRNVNYCYPKDIEDSPLLYEIENCLRIANSRELEFARSESPLEIQRNATNQILEKARELSGLDIQNFDQLATLLISRPEFDDEITFIVKNSGYLTLWKIECQRNPWRYDAREFLDLPLEREKKISLAIEELAAAEQQLNQYEYMYRAYMLLWQKSSLRYFAQEIGLYQNLMALATQRVAAAKNVRDNT